MEKSRAQQIRDNPHQRRVKKELKELISLWSYQLNYLPYLRNLIEESPSAQKSRQSKSHTSVAKTTANTTLLEQKTILQEFSSELALERDQSVSENLGISGNETVHILVGLNIEQIQRQLAWLSENTSRCIVILEPRPEALRAFFQDYNSARSLLLNPQILLLAPKNGLHIAPNKPQLELEYLARFCVHSSFALHVDPLIAQEPLWDAYRGYLLHLCTTFRAIKREALLSPDILDHILRNALTSLENKEVQTLDFSAAPPFVVCGAGPSLTEQIPWLQKIQDHVVIIAAGSSSLALQKAGIRVDLVSGVCAFPEHYKRWRLSKAIMTPVLTCLRVHPGVLKLMQGPRVHLPGLSSSNMITFVERQMGYDGEGEDYGLSVTTATLKALSLANAQNVFLLGVDLCFQEGTKYAEGVPKVHEIDNASSVLDRSIAVKDKDKSIKRTTDPWIQERNWIANFAKSSGVNIYSLQGSGLDIENIHRFTPEAACRKMDKLGTSQCDVTNWVYSTLAQGREHSGSREHLSQMLYAACDDLEQVSEICEEYRQQMLSGEQDICADLESILEFSNGFEESLRAHWSYREFLHYVHWAVKAVQEKERFQMKKDLSLSEKEVATGFFTQLAEQVVLLQKRSKQVSFRLDQWIERHLEQNT